MASYHKRVSAKVTLIKSKRPKIDTEKMSRADYIAYMLPLDNDSFKIRLRLEMEDARELLFLLALQPEELEQFDPNQKRMLYAWYGVQAKYINGEQHRLRCLEQQKLLRTTDHIQNLLR